MCLHFFNLVNFIIFVLILTTGKYANGLFMGVIAANTLIGIIQEIRAKKTIDKLSVMTQAHAVVIREGIRQEIPAAEIVLDDVLYFKTGKPGNCRCHRLDIRRNGSG